jgi:hypothetical protein
MLAMLPPATEEVTESRIMRNIRLFSNRRWRCRLFRNNIGLAWLGKAVVGTQGVFIRRPYQVRFGLCVGSSDLVGFSCVTVTPEMVGTTLAVFTAAEVKRPGGHLTTAQKRFISMVKAMGGRAAAVRSHAEMIAFMDGVQASDSAEGEADVNETP